MIATQKITHWVVWDSQSKKILHLTHEEFNEGLINKWIKLRGDYIEVGTNDRMWIDGIVNNY